MIAGFLGQNLGEFMSGLRVLPVLDLMHGQIVRAVGGRRHAYQPLRSPLAATADPLVVARAFRDHFHLNELYLADLDAIAGAPAAVGIFNALHSDGFQLLVDAGLRSTGDAKPLLAAGVSGIVAGLETVQGPEVVAELIQRVGSARLVFSMDLKCGQLLTASPAAWQNSNPYSLAMEVKSQGVRRLLVLDLAQVGLGGGTGTEALCAQIRGDWPEVELLAGGGIRGREDVDRLRVCGVDGVLAASALHDGRLRAEDLH